MSIAPICITVANLGMFTQIITTKGMILPEERVASLLTGLTNFWIILLCIFHPCCGYNFKTQIVTVNTRLQLSSAFWVTFFR